MTLFTGLCRCFQQRGPAFYGLRFQLTGLPMALPLGELAQMRLRGRCAENIPYRSGSGTGCSGAISGDFACGAVFRTLAENDDPGLAAVGAGV